MAIKFELTCIEIADILDGEFTGNDNRKISGLNNIEFAQSNDITFLSDKKYIPFLDDTKAGCVLVDKKFDIDKYQGINFIVVDDAHQKFAGLIMYIADNYVKINYKIHPKAVIDETSSYGKNVNIGANTVIGENCNIEDNVYIYPNVTIYDNVTIGSGTMIHSGTVIGNDTKIGKNCLILPGAVIGSDGFGFIDNPDGSYTRIPQIGNVVIEDNVEIGANTSIDRALVGSTILNKGVKLDNLIQIAHNVRIGENTAMAAQTGISGSTHIGKRNRFGGQVGLAGHMSIADDVILLAQSGVAKSIDKSGIYFGTPARDRMTAFKIEAVLGQLPDLFKELHHIKKKFGL
jgi:UDP-3-O-[3-hydroxymyristoyl] glucosamine N-acyltransferase